MPSIDRGELRDYGFADRALAPRKRAGLTQRDLAAPLGASLRTIGTWEAGHSYPGPEHLQRLIALYLDRGALAAGREAEEAAALWEAARGQAGRRLAPFDPGWFASLRGGGAVAGTAAPPPPVPDAGPAPWHDWGEAPDVPVLHGRTQELATLARWVDEERCRVVAVLGAGGVGKTTLVARLAQELAPAFAVVHWRSLRDAPQAEEWLAGAIAALSAAQALPPRASRRGSAWCWSCCGPSAPSWYWTTWRPCSSRRRPRCGTGRATGATGRRCGGWAPARTGAACC